jgi:hypothetical protein
MSTESGSFSIEWGEGLYEGKVYKKANVSMLEPIRGWYDITHAYSWDASDLSYVQKVYSIIRNNDKRKDYTEKRKEIARFENLLTRRRNDQTAFDDLNNKYVEPIDIIEKKDRIVNAGRTRAAELIAGEAGNRFDYAGIGLSQVPVSDSDIQLFGEVNRINLRLSGYASASGAIIKHSALWQPGLQSNTYWEFGAFDLPQVNILQMMWCRVVFPPNKGLVHVQNVDFFTVTHSTYTTSVI